MRVKLKENPSILLNVMILVTCIVVMACSPSKKESEYDRPEEIDSTKTLKENPDWWVIDSTETENPDLLEDDQGHFQVLQPLPTPQFSKNPETSEIQWQKIDEGLGLAEIQAPIKSSIGNSRLTILKVDPKVFVFKLLSAKQLGQEKRPIDEWAKEHQLVAAANAGMFLGDQLTSNGFMTNQGFMINNEWNKTYNAVAAFNRKSNEVPPFQIINTRCQDWENLRHHYGTLAQSIRMVDCNQGNKWGKHEKFWSMVLLAEDLDGNGLFIFTRSPYRVHDFIKMLLELPLRINKMMYLEGGPETSFYLDHNGFQRALMGSYETGFNEYDDNDHFWSIPNLIGIVKK